MLPISMQTILWRSRREALAWKQLNHWQTTGEKSKERIQQVIMTTTGNKELSQEAAFNFAVQERIRRAEEKLFED